MSDYNKREFLFMGMILAAAILVVALFCGAMIWSTYIEANKPQQVESK